MELAPLRFIQCTRRLPTMNVQGFATKFCIVYLDDTHFQQNARKSTNATFEPFFVPSIVLG